jgi:hypothetical protein
MILTYDQYASFLIDWCSSRGPSFKYYFPLKGGWELWVQADFAAFVLAKDSTYDILREVNIYTDVYQRVDMLFNENAPLVTDKIAIEIKCQTLLSQNDFIAGVGADIAKLAQIRLKQQFRTCQTGVMGIYFTQQAHDWMLINNFTIIYNDGEVGCGIKKLYP